MALCTHCCIIAFRYVISTEKVLLWRLTATYLPSSSQQICYAQTHTNVRLQVTGGSTVLLWFVWNSNTFAIGSRDCIPIHSSSLCVTLKTGEDLAGSHHIFPPRKPPPIPLEAVKTRQGKHVAEKGEAQRAKQAHKKTRRRVQVL